jgi:uncharacterized protein
MSPTAYSGPIVDVDIHHGWKQPSDILEYLPARWREYATANETLARLGPSGRRAERLPIGPKIPQAFISIPTERGGTRPQDGSPPGSDYPTLKAQILDYYNVYRGVLTYNIGSHVNGQNRDFNVAVARAVHEWNADTWLTYDERLYGVVAPALSVPEEAAAEVRRAGTNPRVVACLLAGTPWNVPFGDPLFHRIYEACAELGLHVHVHPAVASTDRPAGGMSSYASEYATLQTHDAMHHITSLIVNGVFEKYPGLKFIIKEYGIAWLPFLMWRLDANYELLKLESPWVKRWPSEYIREHILLDTQPLDEGPRPDDLRRLLGTVDGLDELLCFASDYPHAASDDAHYVARRLPAGWSRRVMCENACRLYGWDPPADDAVFNTAANGAPTIASPAG